MSSYQGDFVIGSTFDFKFTSMDAGIPTSISGGHVAAYPDNSTTEVLTGITFTPDFDGRTGLNNVRIVMSIGNGYVNGSNYDLVLVSGTIGGKSAIGYAIASFSIGARNTGGTSTDPWATNLTGSYVPNQAGYVLLSRMPTGTVIVGTNQDKSGYSLSSPQVYDRIGNTSGTMTNVQNVLNPIGLVTGSFIDAIADGVWDEQFAGHLLIGSEGERLASRMPSGTVIVGQNNDKTGYGLSSPQSFNLIGNVSGTISAALNVTNPVTVGTNNDKTGYSLSSPQIVNISGTMTNVLNVINPIPSVGMVTGTVVVGSNLDKTGYALTSTEHTNIADALLKRDWTAITGEASRSVLNALRKLRNKVSFNGSNTLSIKKEDDSTNAYTQPVNTNANQDPFKDVG